MNPQFGLEIEQIYKQYNLSYLIKLIEINNESFHLKKQILSWMKVFMKYKTKRCMILFLPKI